MKAPWSLRLRLTVSVVLVVGLALASLSLLLFASFRRALWTQFDGVLTQDARAAADLVEEHADGSLELEPGAVADFEMRPGAPEYEVWTEDGTRIARSRSLGTLDLPRSPGSAAPEAIAFTLPGGRRARLLRAVLAPRSEESGSERSRRLFIAVARETAEVDSTLALLRFELLAAAVVVSTLAAALAAAVVGRGLRAVEVLGKRIDRIDARRLQERIPTDSLPEELAPAADKLNELLARLQSSFEWERRFSADVAHELRTPLAGLLAVLELAASRERTPEAYRQAIQDTTAVAQQMRGLVESLLALARAESGSASGELKDVNLRELVDSSFSLLSAKAKERNLRFENRVPEGLVLRSDPERMRAIAQNLLENAVSYTEQGGWIAAESEAGKGLLLSIADSGPAIPQGARERIFDRFVRLDEARSVGEHHGLGLSLVRALCAASGLTVAAEDRAGGAVAFCIRSKASAR